VPDPEPGPGEVLVRVHSAALNFPDVLILADRYQVSVSPPFTPGSEFAGVVAALGEGVAGPAVGTPVTASAFTGAFAELAVAAADAVHPIPAGLDMVSAAAYRVSFHTAYHALVTVGGGRAGEWVTVLGAAGGVGSAAVDVATRLGLRAVACASSPGRLQLATKLGAAVTVDYATEDLRARLKKVTGGGADLAVDPVGGDHSEQALRALRWGGRFVTLGYADSRIPRIPLNLVLLKNLTVRGFEQRTVRALPGAAEAAEAALTQLVTQGMRPAVGAVYPLSDIATALGDVAGRRAQGKIVVDVTR